MIAIVGRSLPALLAASALAAAVLLAGLLAWNPGARNLTDALLLFGYLWPLHVALLLPSTAVALAALAWGARGRSTPSTARVSATVVAASIAALVALNAILRFHLSYSLLRSAVLVLTPLGVTTLVVFASAPLGVAWAAARAGAGRPPRVAVAAAGAWLLVAAAISLANLHDEVPVPPDVAGVADRATAAGPSAAAGFVARERGAPIERVAVLGFDGLSWHVVDALLQQGRLPNLAALVRSGARGALASNIPTISPTLWTTMATGRGSDAHGIHGFTRFWLPGVATPLERAPRWATMNWWNGLNRILAASARAGFGEQVHYTQAERRVAAVWEVALRAGRSIGLSRWYTTWPVVEQDPGSFMISDFTRRAGSLSPRGPLLAELGVPSQDLPAVPGDSPLRRSERLWELSVRTGNQVDACRALHRRYRPDLAMYYWHYADAIQHLAWRHEQGSWLRGSERDGSPRLSRPVVDAYTLVDGWIGGLAAVLEPRTLLLIVSDHGFSFAGHEHHVAPPGMFLAAGAGVDPGRVIDDARLVDVAPTILAALALPLAATLEGRPLPIFRADAHTVPARVADYGWYTPPSSSVPPSPEVDRETLERLRELGYVN